MILSEKSATFRDHALARLLEPHHSHRQWVTPRADIDGVPRQAATAEFHIGEPIVIGLPGAVGNETRWVPIRLVRRMIVRDFENRDEELAIANHEVREPFQADAEKVERQRREYR